MRQIIEVNVIFGVPVQWFLHTEYYLLACAYGRMAYRYDHEGD